MKHIHLSFRLLVAISAFCIAALSTQAQNVGIGTATPSAKLDISSTNSGILIPRVALTATNAAGPITTPVTSMMVYNTATAGAGLTAVTPGFYYWTGTAWNRVIDLASVSGQTVSGDVSGTLSTVSVDKLKGTPLSITSLATNNLLQYNGTNWVNVTPASVLSAATTHTMGLSGNTLTSVVNGVSATSSAVSGVSNTSSANTLSTTVNGVTGNTVNLINSNALSISGVNLTSTVNGVASTPLDISGASKNIYNTDGSLTGARVVTMAGNNLTFSTTGGNMVLGSGDGTGAPSGGTFRGPNAGSGNTAGGNLTLNAGFGFGSGAGGSVFVNGGTSGSGTNGNIYLRGGFSSGAQGAVYINDDQRGNTFINAAGGITTIGNTLAGTAQLNVNNGLVVDRAATNNGTLTNSNATTTGNGITFGASSGEGIASNRANATAGQNQNGLDFYTNFLRRMSITNGGSVGIGNTNPSYTLDVTGDMRAAVHRTTLANGNVFQVGDDAWISDVNTANTAAILGAANAAVAALQLGSNASSYIYGSGGNVGVKTTTLTQDFNVGGRMLVANGVIQNGTIAITATSDLGLYSQTSGNWIRIASNNAPIKFFTDQGGGNSAGTNDAMSILQTGQITVAAGQNIMEFQRVSCSSDNCGINSFGGKSYPVANWLPCVIGFNGGSASGISLYYPFAATWSNNAGNWQVNLDYNGTSDGGNTKTVQVMFVRREIATIPTGSSFP
jgi:hypothetical protein